MSYIKPPIKPFDSYKWRLAELTPTEGLNDPRRFLGVLRVLKTHEGEKAGSSALRNDLKIVEVETNQLIGGKGVGLARTAERPLLRNSGRYWKALGVIDIDGGKSGVFQVTSFGSKVAAGEITQDEFALAVVKAMSLPNQLIEADLQEWRKAKLQIKPLELILRILNSIYSVQGVSEAYITTFELIHIIIPLAGVKASIEQYVDAIIAFRKDKLDISNWPDCATDANDERMAREYLLFLAYYGFCTQIKATHNDDEKYYLVMSSTTDLAAIIGKADQIEDVEEVAIGIQQEPLTTNIGRARRTAEVLVRPQQAQFRKDVLAKYKSECLLTGEKMSEVLQACHIIPVSDRGSDSLANALCLRVDIHILFDTGHLRIAPNGTVRYTDAALKSAIYSLLPAKIKIPVFVSSKALEMRWKYY
jgi:hypothetical protein